MKKLALSSLAVAFLAFAAPASACVGNACPATTTPTTTPASSGSSVWGGFRGGLTAQTFGSGWNNDDGAEIVARGVGQDSIAEGVVEGDAVASTCGTCATNSVTARVTGLAGQRSFSYLETTGRYAEGGSTAQVNTEGGFDGYVGRENLNAGE